MEPLFDLEGQAAWERTAKALSPKSLVILHPSELSGNPFRSNLAKHLTSFKNVPDYLAL